jgi:hypothetical protein
MKPKLFSVLIGFFLSLIIASALAACGQMPTSSDVKAMGQGRAHGLVPRHLTSMLDGESVPTTEFTREAPYIDWLGNGNVNNATAGRTAGLKVFWYSNITHMASPDPSFTGSDFARNCQQQKVYSMPGNKKLYLTDPTSANVLHVYETKGAGVGMLPAVTNNYEAVMYDAAAKWLGIVNGPICVAPSYTQAWDRQAWITASANFIAKAAADTGYHIVNGRSTAMGYNGLDAVDPASHKYQTPNGASDIAAGVNPPSTTGLDAGGGWGGRDEGCYGPGGFRGTTYGNFAHDDEWIAYENTEILVGLIDSAHFVCQYGFGLQDTNMAHPGRLYAFASYMLTYNPDTDILFDAFLGTDNVQGDPEEQLVFLNPALSNGSLKQILQLAQPPGANQGYGREYGACYNNGVSLGKCAVLVNPYASGNINWQFTGYTKTLQLNGSTILDGGTVTIGGPAPTSLPPESAEIGFQ